MPDISIIHEHELTHAKAKAAAQKVADKLVEQFDMQSQWEGDVLIFQRSGVTGVLTVDERAARLDITLGFVFKAFSGKIEEEGRKTMRKVFGSRK